MALAAAAGSGHRFALPAGLVPGLAVTAGVCVLAYGLRRLPGLGLFSPLILAIVAGVVVRALVPLPAAWSAGTRFAARRLLRLAIILLGAQITVAQILSLGGGGVVTVVATLAVTFAATAGLGRLVGVEPKLARLIGAGTAVCGASAVVATNAVTGADEEDVAYAVGLVTVFGTIAMLAYPLLPDLLGLDAARYGLWAGSSIHEIAQVVGATFQHGPVSGDSGTISKLGRVILLGPLVLALGALARRQARGVGGPAASVPMPWFVFGFIALAAVNSLGVLPAETKGWVQPATTALLAMGLAAMGLETRIDRLRAKGWRPFLLGALATLVAAGTSLGLIKLFF